ncbi:MAG: hypothetical protein M1484_01925 [Patescibacteria group bacterium]|nr:hypothetical protein [Patescibacteria group bacterium]
MKKLSILIVTIAVLSLTSVAYASKNETGAQGTGSQTGNQGTTTQGQQQVVASPTGNQVQNQNQVQTQNQGEDTQLKVNTQEQENLGEGTGTGSQNRSQNAVENMSNVAEQVQELQQIRTTGGIGEQVRQVAQEQNQAQNQIQTELGKVDNRTGLLKSLIGPDYKALKSMQKVMEQNQLRIQQLEQLQNQLTNQSDITMVQETIQALTEQNTALQDKITLEEQSGSLLGWLFKLFAR